MCISVQVLYISSTFRTDYDCLTVNKDLNDFRRIFQLKYVYHALCLNLHKNRVTLGQSAKNLTLTLIYSVYMGVEPPLSVTGSEYGKLSP